MPADGYGRERAHTGATSHAPSEWGASQAATSHAPSQWGASQGVKTFQSSGPRPYGEGMWPGKKYPDSGYGRTLTGNLSHKTTFEPVERSVLPDWYRDGYAGCGRVGKFFCSYRMMFACCWIAVGFLTFGIVFWYTLGLSAPQTKMLAWAIDKRPVEGIGVYEGTMFLEVSNPTEVDLHFEAIEGELGYRGYFIGGFTVTARNGTYSIIPAGTTALFQTVVRTRPWEDFGTAALVGLGADALTAWGADDNLLFDIPIHLRGGWIKTPVGGLTRSFTFDMSLSCNLGVDLNRNLGLALGRCPTAHLTGHVAWHADRGMCLEHFDLNSTSTHFKRGLRLVPCSNNETSHAHTFKYDWSTSQITSQVEVKASSFLGGLAQGIGLASTYETQCIEANAFRSPSVGLTKCDSTGRNLGQQFWTNATNGVSTITLASGWDTSALLLDCFDVDDSLGHPNQSKPIQLRRCQYSRSNRSQTFIVPWTLCDIGSEWAKGLSEAQHDQLKEGASVCGGFSFGGGLRTFLTWYGGAIVFTICFALCVCGFRGYRVSCSTNYKKCLRSIKDRVRS